MKGYVPQRGDAVWLEFDPRAGREQAGRRPALVLSDESYNRPTGLGVFCPIASHAKGYPFEVSLPSGLKVAGVVLADHLKSLDWRARKARFICRLPDAVVEDVCAKIAPLLDPGG